MSKETEDRRDAVAGPVERTVGRQLESAAMQHNWKQMNGCKCTFAQYMVGDGCDVCNPARALEYARETMAELQAHRDMLAAALRRLIDCCASSHSPKVRADCWAQAQKALDFDA